MREREAAAFFEHDFGDHLRHAQQGFILDALGGADEHASPAVR